MPRRKRPSYKLGCHLTPHEPLLRLCDYVSPRSVLPTPPPNFGNADLVTDWGMLGNDEAGDCVIAGAYHAEMLWNAEGDHAFGADTAVAIDEYSATTGYVPGEPATDGGADPEDVATYWQHTGLIDTGGNRHKIVAYIDLTPGNLTELWLATYIFQAVGVCLALPQQWMDDFGEGQRIWHAIEDPKVAGGHYVLGVGRSNGNLNVVTWGGIAHMTPAAYRQANMRTLVYLSEEMIRNGVSVDGFRWQTLLADLRALELM